MADGRDWNGLLNDTSDIGDGLLKVDNCSLFTKNMLNRRPGFDLPIKTSAAATVMGELSSYLITCESNGGLYAYDQATGASSTILSTYNPATIPSFVPAFSRMYTTDGAQSVGVISNSIATPAVSSFTDIAYDGTSKWVIVGSSGAVAYSINNGASWTRVAGFTAYDFRSIAFGGGVFVAVGGTGYNPVVFTSTDGITWTAATFTVNVYITSVIFAGSVFVLLSTHTTYAIFTSSSGATWTQRTTPYNNAAARTAVVYSGTKYVYIAYNYGTNVTYSYSSTDSITWTATALSGVLPVTGLAFGGSLFISFLGAQSVTSSDAITWANAGVVTSTPGFNVTAIKYLTSAFLVVGNSLAFRSAIGATWSSAGVGFPVALSANAIGFTGSNVIAVGINSTPGYEAAFSTDGGFIFTIASTTTIPVLSYRNAGIIAPSGTPTGGTPFGTSTPGTHLIRYRYVDATRNRLSNPSTAVSVISTAVQAVSISVVASGDAFVTGIQVEMSGAGASTFYIASTNANTTGTISVSMTDDILVIKIPSSVNGDFGHSPPPTYLLMCENRQRMWMMDPTSGLLTWSQPGYPESFDTTSNARIITLPGGDVATAIFGFYSDLYIVGQRSMMRLVYSTDPAGSMLLPVLGSMGAFNNKCIFKTSTGEVYGWGRDGMWRINSMQPEKISRHIVDNLTDNVNPSLTANRFVCYDPIQQTVLFFFASVGEIVPRAAFVFNVIPVNQDSEWTSYYFRQGFNCACYNSSSTDRQRLALGDANAYIWRFGTRNNDGGVGSALSVTSATTTVINGTNTAVAGMMAYRPTTGEEKLITAVSAGSITVSAFATAPAAGDLIYCGSIRQRWLTQQFTANSAMNKKRPSYLELIVHPQATTSGVFTVRFYLDFSTSASQVTSNSADTWPNGISIVNGTDIRVDAGVAAADGYIAVPMFADFQRAVQAEIIADYPATGLRFYDFKWGFTNRMQQVPVIGE